VLLVVEMQRETAEEILGSPARMLLSSPFGLRHITLQLKKFLNSKGLTYYLSQTSVSMHSGTFTTVQTLCIRQESKLKEKEEKSTQG
jgi:hypothetical protein